MSYERLNPVDRVPATGKTGRVLITPESGDPFYAVMTLADDATVTGTKINALMLSHFEDEFESLENLKAQAYPKYRDYYSSATSVTVQAGASYDHGSLVSFFGASNDFRRVVITIRSGNDTVLVEIMSDGNGTYKYHCAGMMMSGGTRYFGIWVPEWNYNSDVLGSSASGTYDSNNTRGVLALGQSTIAIKSLTFTEHGIRAIFYNYGATEATANFYITAEAY